jgi:ribosomal protein L16/L10AE
VSYSNVAAPAGTKATIKVGETVINVAVTDEEISAAKEAAEKKDEAGE